MTLIFTAVTSENDVPLCKLNVDVKNRTAVAGSVDFVKLELKLFNGKIIFHGCMVWIEKSVTRVTDRHHEACRVMPNSDPEVQIFLSTPNTHDRYFFLHNF